MIIWYFIQGHYKKFILKEYNRLFYDDSVVNLMYKAARCSDCVNNGMCLECGCLTIPKLLSDKPCKKDDSPLSEN